MPKQSFYIMADLFMPPAVVKQSQRKCPTCRRPAIYVQPRAQPPAYAFACEKWHIWGFIDGKLTKQTWENEYHDPS